MNFPSYVRDFIIKIAKLLIDHEQIKLDHVDTGKKQKYQDRKKIDLDFKIWAALSSIILFFLAFFHFRGMAEKTRELINYDDLIFIKPLLNKNLHDYWFKWLPDRLNYAFPLRDMTFYIDKSLSEIFGLNIFWISNFIYFVVGMCIFGLIIQKNFFANRYLTVAGILLLYSHPLHIEVIQWLTCRKYLIAAIPIAIGTYLFDRWKNEDISFPRLFVILGLWLASLASYPTAVLWIFWVIGGFYLKHQATSAKKYAIWSLFSAVIAAFYLDFVGSSTWEVKNSYTSIMSISDRAFSFAINGLGRGFLNLVFPVYLSSHYNEMSNLNLIGIVLLGLFSLLVYFCFRSFKKNSLGMVYLKLGLFWVIGGLFLIIPCANTILSFRDFMLGDRYFFMAIPFFIVGGCYFIKAVLEEKPKFFGRKILAFSVGFVLLWTLGSLIIAYQRVPLWRDSLILFDDCRQNEKAAKCYIEVIARQLPKGECSRIQSTINEASHLYNKIRYSGQFRIELPFFHSNCIAIDKTMSPEDKFNQIRNLTEFYGSSPEIVFALTLTLLEAGNLEEAIKMAEKYYMGPLELGSIEATFAIEAIYLGQIIKICEISPTPQCFERLTRFADLHPNVKQFPDKIHFGKFLTDMMAKRGGLIK